MRDYDGILTLVAAFLNREKAEYMLVGAVAVSCYGTPRTSEDIDIVVVLGDEGVRRFVAFLRKNDFSVSERDIAGAFAQRSHFTVFDRRSLFRLDIKGAYGEFDRLSLSRRRKVKALGMALWLCSPEDCILSKLEYGSLKGVSDISSIIRRRGRKLDRAYMLRQSKRMGTAAKLLKLLR